MLKYSVLTAGGLPVKKVTAAIVLTTSSLLAASVLPASAVSLIDNGGFESGDFTGWNVAADATGVEPSGFAEYTSHSGNFFAALGNVGGDGTIAQTVTDMIGQQYVLTYFLASNGTSPSDFHVEWDGVTLAGSAVSNPPSGNYMEYSFLVAGTGSDTLTFFERNDPSYLALDDVALTTPVAATPLPAGLPLLATGLGGLGLLGWRRKRRAQALV
jgi:hypothetical protein